MGLVFPIWILLENKHWNTSCAWDGTISLIEISTKKKHDHFLKCCSFRMRNSVWRIVCLGCLIGKNHNKICLFITEKGNLPINYHIINDIGSNWIKMLMRDLIKTDDITWLKRWKILTETVVKGRDGIHYIHKYIIRLWLEFRIKTKKEWDTEITYYRYHIKNDIGSNWIRIPGNLIRKALTHQTINEVGSNRHFTF